MTTLIIKHKITFGIITLIVLILATVIISSYSSGESKGKIFSHRSEPAGPSPFSKGESKSKNSSANGEPAGSSCSSSKKKFKLSCGTKTAPYFKDGEKSYAIVTHEDTLKVIDDYKNKLSNDLNLAGNNLRSSLQKLFKVYNGEGVSKLTRTDFIEAILASKQISAGAAGSSFGPNRSWSKADVQTLGDLNVVVPVKIYDNGQWSHPQVHDASFDGYLLFTPGALLEDSNNDYDEVVVNGEIDIEAYCKLYERRLLSLFRFANEEAAAKGKKAIVTVPGLGCSIFAGKFSREIHDKFNMALKSILKKYSSDLKSIDLVYYGRVDKKGANELIKYDDRLKYRMCFSGTSEYRNQLDKPSNFKFDSDEDYSNHILFSFVAWSHLCLPGNTFFYGNRCTDDGVKAAATSTMSSLFPDVGAAYDKSKYKYLPKTNSNWSSVASASTFHLSPKQGLFVLEEDKELDKKIIEDKE